MHGGSARLLLHISLYSLSSRCDKGEQDDHKVCASATSPYRVTTFSLSFVLHHFDHYCFCLFCLLIFLFAFHTYSFSFFSSLFPLSLCINLSIPFTCSEYLHISIFVCPSGCHFPTLLSSLSVYVCPSHSLYLYLRLSLSLSFPLSLYLFFFLFFSLSCSLAFSVFISLFLCAALSHTHFLHLVPSLFFF